MTTKITALPAAASVASATLFATVDAAGTTTEKATGTQVADFVLAADAEIAALAGLTSAADRLPYFTGSGAAALATFTAAGRALVDDADAAAQRTTLGLVIGTNVQAFDAELAALAGLTSAADKLPYFTGSGTAALADISSAMRTFLTTPNSANLAALVTDDQFLLSDVELGAIAGLTSAADKLPYFTGSGTAALADLSSAMRTFLTTSSSANFAAVLTDETGSGGGFVRATGPSMSGIVQSVSATVTAAGTTQGTATALTSDFNVLTTVTGAANGVSLPATPTGLTVVVYNADSADTASVYPATGDAIDALAANAAFSLPAGQMAIFYGISASQWYSSKLEATAIAGLTGTLGVANGGTGTTTQFTAGSVVFAGASGVYSQDNANLFWDDTNNRLGIGTASPSVPLHVAANTNGQLEVRVANSSAGASSASIINLITGTANGYATITVNDNGGSPNGGIITGSAMSAWSVGTAVHNFYNQAFNSLFAALSSTGLQLNVPMTAGALNYAADAQASDTYVITLAPAPTAYSTGMIVVFKANTANTGAATINVNSLGAKTIVKAVNTTLANNDILASMICMCVYDGTNFVLMNPRAL